jgi:hypothetical protein
LLRCRNGCRLGNLTTLDHPQFLFGAKQSEMALEDEVETTVINSKDMEKKINFSTEKENMLNAA